MQAGGNEGNPMTTVSLVRVTIDAPGRRVDLALPERSPVAEFLPGLLRKAGESLADDGVAGGGWLLRRDDGTVLEAGRALGTYGIRDGEVLHLVPRKLHWPELEYDDLADAIAQGAGRTGRQWAPTHTRAAGLLVTALAALLAVLAVLRAGPPWGAPSWAALGFAVLLLAAGTALARGLGDAGAGAVIAAFALPFAFTGGALLPGGELALSGFGAPHVLSGAAVLMLASALGYLGVVERAGLFVAGVTAGLLGVLAAWLASMDALDGVDGAAATAVAVLLFSPLFGTLSMRLGRVPMPVLPRSASDLLRDDPLPPRHAVYATVIRADQLLTGLIGGASGVALLCVAIMATQPTTSVIVLLSVLTLAFCVRARLYPALRHRGPLLGVGVSCAAALTIGPFMADPAALLPLTAPLVLAAGGFAALLGLLYSKRRPTPFFGRSAQIVEIVLVLACVPITCGVLGLYGIVRGLGG